MSRLSSWFHRTFGGYGPIVKEVADAVFLPLIRDFIRHPDWTADERRSVAYSAIKEYLERKYPHYEWLVEVILESVLPFIEGRLAGKRG